MDVNDAHKSVEGPPMICATRILRPGGARIGRIAGGFTLPRTVPVVTAVFVGVFGVLGLILAMLAGADPTTLGIGAAIGGGIGYGLATFSPLRGESMTRWILLTVTGSRRKRRIDGKPVILAVGTAPAGRVPVGIIRVRQSAVRVRPGTVDERGVPITRSDTGNAHG